MTTDEKKKYSTDGLNSRQQVEQAMAAADYRPSQEVTDAANDLKQWQEKRPGSYESAYQGRIDSLLNDLLGR